MDLILFLPTLLFLLLLILLSAFFSGSESALTAASPARMHALAAGGDWRAALVNKILARKDRLIGAILLGNNTVNTLIASVSTVALVQVFGDSGIYYATIAVTFLLLIFGEVLPKTLALYHPDAFARFVAPAVHLLVMVASPVVLGVTWIVRRVLQVAGVDLKHGPRGSDMDELRGAIDLHQGPDEETGHRRTMLRSILDLADVHVGDIMIHRKNATMVDIDLPPENAVGEILSTKHSRVPLWQGGPDNIVGIIHVKTLLLALADAGGNAQKIDLKAMMLAPWFVPDTTSLFDQLHAFRARREHFAAVVDEYGTLQGIVTLEDILEEIVGHIDDEQDLVIPGVRRLPGGAYLVNGDFSIRDLNRELGWKLPDDADYTTVAGLVIYESRSVPDAGQSFSFHGHRFDILKRQRNQITLLRITAAG